MVSHTPVGCKQAGGNQASMAWRDVSEGERRHGGGADVWLTSAPNNWDRSNTVAPRRNVI